jgi:hypothetical protein
MAIGVQITGTNIKSWLSDIVSKEKDALKSDYKSAVVPRTPILTGKARRGWQKRTNEIRNDVNYIGKLETGYSRQAPKGFVKQALTTTIDKSNKRKY